MSDDRLKVKDLATELGLSTRDILAAAKDLGISTVKVAASSLSAQDAARLRARFAPAGSEKQEVIVRRRKRPGAGHKEEEASLPERSTLRVAESEARETEEEREHPVPVEESATPVAPPASGIPDDSSDKAAPAPLFKAEKSVRSTSDGDAVREKSRQKKQMTARVLHRPGDAPLPGTSAQGLVKDAAKSIPLVAAPAEFNARKSSETVHPGTSSGVDASEASDSEKIEKSAERALAASAEPEQTVSADEVSAETDSLAPRKNMARVVRPAAFSAEPERGADGQTVSSAPATMPFRSESAEGARAGSVFDGNQQDDEAQPASRVRVISRPDPRQNAGRPQPRQDNRGADGRSGQRPRGGQGDARPSPPRPGGGARPAGAAAPAGRSGGYAPRPAGNAQSGFTPASPEGGEQGRKKRQKGRRTVDFVDTRAKGDEDTAWSKSAPRRSRQRKQREVAPLGGTQPVKAAKRKIKVDEFIRVSDLAHQMGLKSSEIIKVLFALGVMATINQSLDIDTATLVAGEFGYDIEKTGFSEQDVLDAQHEHFDDSPDDYTSRPPVVTIMGHVDHGKTSLLDAIRKSSVVTGEAGGITQHIGAYHVKTKKGEIVFLDTPGHEAFTAMRARGAEVTDIVVLVVAADDGVMEQTKEAINHARAANVPIMVAVNKMDKEGANPDRVKRELAEQGLVPEEWGGDVTFSYVSAKTRQGLDELLELLALQAEILELKANSSRPAMGHIVEAKLDKGRGALGTVLIQQGTLHVGDAFVCGVHSGRVRAMFNDQGKKVKEAGPSIPVEVQGFEGVPEAGEEFLVIADEKAARRIAESRALKQRERELARESKITLETFLARKADSVEAETLNLVVKADVQGSLEAISDALRKLSNEKVRIVSIHGGTGAISESDVLLATASNAIILGFNVRPTVKAKELAEQEKVDIRFYDIIYKLVEEIRSAMEGMLAPVEREISLGTAEIRETFSVPKVGVIAGCHVSDGKITRNAQARLLRDGVVVHSGKVASLRRFKDDVREVAKGYECGIGLENYNDIKVGDVIEAFEVVEEAATL